MLGEDRQAVREVRSADAKGRHTTTHRELFSLASGGFLIDTPGLREVQLWSADDGMAAGFPEIDDLSADCFFADCSHTSEKGCAVVEALENGRLPRERYDSYHKIQREQFWLKEKQETAGKLNRKRRFKEISKEIRKFYKESR